MPTNTSCSCGCGQTVRIVRGRPNRFVHGHAAKLQPRKVMTKSCRCGREFSGPPSQIIKRTHCSKECQKRPYPFTCEGCGYEGVSRYEGRRFCGDGCRLAWFSAAFVGEFSPQWRGGSVAYYGPSWDAARDATRERDGYCCQECGVHESELSEQLSVAHIIAFRVFGIANHELANALDNLRSLCRRCHLIFDHANGTRALTDQLLALERAA